MIANIRFSSHSHRAPLFAQTMSRRTVEGALLALLAALVLLPGAARSNQVFSTDCAFGLKNNFGSDEIVCVSGDVDTKPPGPFVIFPEGDVYVTENRVWSFGDGLADVTAGGFNTVVGTSIGGGFFDEMVWLPPLTPGRYDVVLDENQDGTYNPGDFVAGSGSGWEFQVGAPVGANIDVAAIKGAASDAFDNWDGLAKNWHWVSDSATAISMAWAAGSGDWVSVGVGIFGAVTGIPTDYNSGVLSIGGKVIEGAAAQQARRWKGLRDDPPDPNFTEFVALDLASFNADLAAQPGFPGIPNQYPFSTLGDSSYEAAQIELANRVSMQAALVDALLHSIEKYQGAVIGADDDFTFLQADAVKKYLDLLVGNMVATRAALVDYQAEQSAAGFGATVYDAGEIQALKDRLTATGFTAAEIDDLKASGFTDADLAAGLARVAGLDVPATSFTRDATLSGVIASIDATLPVFQNASAEAQAVMDDLGPFLLQTHPIADSDGPYAGVEGVAINFDGSGSSDPNGDPLSYEWDFDLDGLFDDASGAAAAQTYGQEGPQVIGLRVTDPDGNYDIDYAAVAVASGNGTPEITSFAPADTEPSASNASPLAFDATASDPDGDPLSFEWTVDGVPVSTALGFTYTPAVGATGFAIVRLSVSDGNPLSNDAVELRVVRHEGAPPVMVAVPDVVGLAQAAAEAAIGGAGLVVGTVSAQNSDTVPAGDVISQDPVGGTSVPEGSAVDLVVSLGPAMVAVPDVVGLAQAAAEAAIGGAGLVVGTVSTQNSDTVPAGAVISQDPVGGTAAAPGSAVDLLVSLGPALTVVPDVVGLAQAAAEAAIGGAGLVVGTVSTQNSDTVPAGAVISQDPVGGTAAAPGSAVDLLVSLGSALIAVPDVVGLPQADAEAAIVVIGLDIGDVTGAHSDVVPAGDVISQNPVAGTEVAPGSAVDLVVSLGPVAPERCDVDGNGSVDREDVDLIFAARGTVALGPDDPRDADGDGIITVGDGRLCVLQCDLETCEPVQDDAGAGGGARGVACGLVGLEPLLALVMPWWIRQRRSGRRTHEGM